MAQPLPLGAPADVAPTGELAGPWDGPGVVLPPAVAQQAGPAVPGGDIRVFPSNTPQTEMSIAVNPANPANLLITSNTSGSSPQGYYYSFDGGQTWGGSNDYPNGILSRGDPVSVFDADGVAYDVTLLGSPPSVARVRSLDGGVTWDDFRILDPGNGLECDDKEHAVVDTDDASPFRNSFYAAWTDFSFGCFLTLPGYVRVVFTTSNDDFSVRHVLDEQFGFDIGQGVNVQVGAEEGQVYVIWSVYTGGQLPEAGMGFTRSVDGGLTFQPPTVAFPYSGIRTTSQEHLLFNGTRVNSFPSMAVDHSFGPHRGRIYVAYADRSTGDFDVYVRYAKACPATRSSPSRGPARSATARMARTSGRRRVSWR